MKKSWRRLLRDLWLRAACAPRSHEQIFTCLSRRLSGLSEGAPLITGPAEELAGSETLLPEQADGEASASMTPEEQEDRRPLVPRTLEIRAAGNGPEELAASLLAEISGTLRESAAGRMLNKAVRGAWQDLSGYDRFPRRGICGRETAFGANRALLLVTLEQRAAGLPVEGAAVLRLNGEW